VKKLIEARVIDLKVDVLKILSVFSNLLLWKANRRIADAKTSANSGAFIMDLPKMRVLNVA
jgi:hypothetical protein